MWVLGGIRVRLPRVVVLRVLPLLSPSCTAVDTRTVPGLMDAVERDRDRGGGSVKLLLDMERVGSQFVIVVPNRSQLTRPSKP
jgi:hypothetical protein